MSKIEWLIVLFTLLFRAIRLSVEVFQLEKRIKRLERHEQ